jgi:hypothetical protein
MSTTLFCPRCGVEMTLASDRVHDVTCPYCLAHVKVDRPIPVLPLEYAGPQVDADAELRRDQSTMAAGILVFALMATATLLAIKIQTQIHISNIYIFGWVGFLTVIVALRRFTGLSERRMSAKLGLPQEPKTPMQRAGSIALLGVWGAVLAVLSLAIGGVAIIVIIFVACTGV